MSEVGLRTCSKTIWGKIVFFYICWPLEVKPLTWDQIWRHNLGRAVTGLSFAFFRAALALLVHELERLKLRIVEMVEYREHFIFDDLWWLDLWPDLKNDQSFPSDFGWAFERRLPHVAT